MRKFIALALIGFFLTSNLWAFGSSGCDSSTVLLGHYDADFSDSGCNGTGKKTVTNHNASTIDNTNFVFGGGSAHFAFSSLQYIDYGDSTDWAFGTGDFEIDFRVRFDSFPLVNVFLDMNPVSDELDIDYFNGGNTFRVALHGVRYTFAWTPSTGIYYYVKINRTGTSLKVFIDNAQIGTTQTSSDNVGHTELDIGAYSNGVSAHDGNIDELRITKGDARVGMTTTPTTPYCSGCEMVEED